MSQTGRLPVLHPRPSPAMPSLGMRRDRLEALMETGARKYKSDFARRHYERGWAEGMAEGMLTVLSARDRRAGAGAGSDH